MVRRPPITTRTDTLLPHSALFLSHPTHVGYFLATIPVVAARFSVGVQFGALCEWIQIEDAAFHPVESFGRPGKTSATPAQLIHDGMEEEIGKSTRLNSSH